jgi:hypothetical protein
MSGEPGADDDGVDIAALPRAGPVSPRTAPDRFLARLSIDGDDSLVPTVAKM